MSAYNLETVIKKWGQGTLTSEQAIGQILLMIKELSGRVGELEKYNAAQQVKKRADKKANTGK